MVPGQKWGTRLMLAENHLTKRLFARMVRRMKLYRCQPGRFGKRAKSIWTTEEVEGEGSEKSLRNGANYGFLVLARALPGASGSLALERMQRKIAAAATGSILSSPGKQNGNSG